MSVPSSDSYEYKEYSMEYYRAHAGPPLIKKTSRLIAAVVQNQVDILRELLDSPKWYNVTDKCGYSLLQIAILRTNKEVFEYMLSIPDFPLEFVNKTGKTGTALRVALTQAVHKSNCVTVTEDFALELLKKGACIDKVADDEGNTLLHCALQISFINVAKFLIKAGDVDIDTLNNAGSTPLDYTIFNNFDEIIISLIEGGVVPTIQLFENSVLECYSSHMQDTLFFCIFDRYCNMEVEFVVLLELAMAKSYLFHELVKYPMKVAKDDYMYYSLLLLSMETDYLKMLIDNHPSCIEQIFTSHIDKVDSSLIDFSPIGCDYPIGYFLENLDMLLNSAIKSDIINFLSTPHSCDIWQRLLNPSIGFTDCPEPEEIDIDETLMRLNRSVSFSESNFIDVLCYLASYGFNISDQHVEWAYNNFGYGELFKTLLHMDIIKRENVKKTIMPALIYDVRMDLQKYFQNPDVWYSMNELLDHFAHPQLEEIYNQGSATKRENIPQIPLLAELARNSFRRFFIETFQIKTSRKFYTLLRGLQINDVYKKIISYETKLYNK